MKTVSFCQILVALVLASCGGPKSQFGVPEDAPDWASEPTLERVDEGALQPLLVHVARLREALNYLGEPLTEKDNKTLDAASIELDVSKARRQVQEVLDPYCLVVVNINPEARVKVLPGPAPRQLVHKGWRQFLVKVHNQAGVTAPLNATSPQAEKVFGHGVDDTPPSSLVEAAKVRDRWLDMSMYDGRPLAETLSGSKLEYRVLQLYSRDVGKRSAILAFDVGQGTQDIGFRSDVVLTFDVNPSTSVTLRVRDENDQPTTAAFVIRDRQDRVYPSRAKRLAPDFAFHPQIYRNDGETLHLPAGQYRFECSRGPEYLSQTKNVRVADEPLTVDFELQRWIDPSTSGWWSGDHHIHAAGCAHYSVPTEGVGPATIIIRHIRGEDLKVGSTLTWGPGFDYQKRFFSGSVDKVSSYPYLLRYDVEVSGFGSHESGHLCLLRLKEQIYPGGESKDHWPTLCLNTLRWAKKQGAVCGPAHSGYGLAVNSTELPNYLVPRFDGNGALEYIVDITHQVPGPTGELEPAVDFMSLGDSPYPWELNIWYHTLNCGFRARVSGETDFPCVYGERVGMGRAYIKLDGNLDYDNWCQGIRLGRAYVSDGRSHLMDFKVDGVEVGTRDSEVRLDEPGRVQVSARIAARLEETALRLSNEIQYFSIRDKPEIQKLDHVKKPFWHIERARIGDTRTVPVEVIVNGYPVAREVITADGRLEVLHFEVEIERSSWIALRILPSSHTNPLFVLVAGKPIRASQRSAEWCLKSVEQCWGEKSRFIAKDEMEDAIAAYDHARQTYRQILAESEVP